MSTSFREPAPVVDTPEDIRDNKYAHTAGVEDIRR